MLETKHIKDALRRLYEGEVWHGPSIKEILIDITPEQAVKRLTPKSKNIAEYLIHITNWRTFALEKLTGGDTFDIILNSEADWSVVNEITKDKWEEIQEAYEESQKEILEVLETYTDRKLENIVPGRKYSFYTLLYGVIHHDIYHSGQMMLLKRLALEM